MRVCSFFTCVFIEEIMFLELIVVLIFYLCILCFGQERATVILPNF